MSAFHPIATQQRTQFYVGFVPGGDIGTPPPAQRIGVASSQRCHRDHADFAGVARIPAVVVEVVGHHR